MHISDIEYSNDPMLALVLVRIEWLLYCLIAGIDYSARSFYIIINKWGSLSISLQKEQSTFNKI
jgi:hypothetical protein